MSTEEFLRRLRSFNRAVEAGDEELRSERSDTSTLESMPAQGPVAELEYESIILRKNRPVLAIQSNRTVLEFGDEGDSKVWKERLGKAGQQLEIPIPAVGRINLHGSSMDWVGTGWLLSDDIMVTNRHVAEAFAREKDGSFVFSESEIGDGMMSAEVDFLEEIGRTEQLMFRILCVLYIEPRGGPDLAFVRVEPTAGALRLAKPISLSSRPTGSSPNVAVIGYPAYDSRIPDVDLMSKVFGEVYDKKRIAPGAIIGATESQLFHDCTTLGGNSGSVVVDLLTGEAIGLHFSGRFGHRNYAVPASIVKQRLDQLNKGAARSVNVRDGQPAAVEITQSLAVQPSVRGGRGEVTFTIPLAITVSFGAPQGASSSSAISATTSPAISVAATPTVNGKSSPSGDRALCGPSAAKEDVRDANEGRVADYSNRKGYNEKFLGKGFKVNLPEVLKPALKKDVLTFESGDVVESILRYEHYSVVMSESRRVCRFSAVNIDGGLSKKTPRAGWRTDPRIPKSQQILNECYGSPPKFSRGHMTRREDPAWGSISEAAQGNEDSMHVTNTVPQMQAFNAPIWLALEDYALQNARADEMKISVFTGPYLEADDPVFYRVQVPRSFWKIIAFVHDKTNQLTATGYEMSQQANLAASDEFVFGAFQSAQLNLATQVSIRSIEKKSGLAFGTLAAHDPFRGGSEGRDTGENAVRLFTEQQIRFY